MKDLGLNFTLLKIVSIGAEEMGQLLRAPVLFQWTWVGFPAPTWHITTVHTSSSKESGLIGHRHKCAQNQINELLRKKRQHSQMPRPSKGPQLDLWFSLPRQMMGWGLNVLRASCVSCPRLIGLTSVHVARSHFLEDREKNRKT